METCCVKLLVFIYMGNSKNCGISLTNSCLCSLTRLTTHASINELLCCIWLDLVLQPCLSRKELPTHTGLVCAALATTETVLQKMFKRAQSAAHQCLLHARRTPLLPGGAWVLCQEGGWELAPTPVPPQLCPHHCSVYRVQDGVGWFVSGLGQHRRVDLGTDLKRVLGFCVSVISTIQLKISVIWEEKLKSRELLGVYENSTSKYIVPCMPLVKWLLRGLNLCFSFFFGTGVLCPALFPLWSPCILAIWDVQLR